jgi:glutaredoxin 3
LLTRKQAAFTEFDAGVDPDARGNMYARVHPGATFPQIFIDGAHVGGCDDLYALDREGRLDAMLAGQKATT